MSLKAAMVLTTINNPVLLSDYYNNFKKNGLLENVNIIVVADKKTPETAFTQCQELQAKGMKIDYLDLEAQESYLKKFNKLSNIIPYNSDNRRNIGFLKAYEADTDFLISIDDDNYPISEENFIMEHSVVCSAAVDAEVIESQSHWFNICSLLELEPNLEIYPRGYPYYERHKPQKLSQYNANVQIKINAGLWLKEPDIDGLTWLNIPVRSNRFKNKSIILSNATWSPINTQNTALNREVIASYYYIKMGYPIKGFYIDRYGDIFSGYFCQACTKSLGHQIRVGTPIAEHIRNSHNYLNDATNEMAGIWILEELLPWLTEVKLSGYTYIELYESLSHQLEDFSERQHSKFWTEEVKGYFHLIAYNMRTWLDACKTINQNR